MPRDLGPSLGWFVTTMALVAKIIASVVLASEFLRILSLRSFRAPVMSPRREILGFLVEPLIVPKPICQCSRACCLPQWVTMSCSRLVLRHHAMISWVRFWVTGQGIWCPTISVPRPLDALGGLEAHWASLRTISDAPSKGSHAGVWLGGAIQ